MGNSHNTDDSFALAYAITFRDKDAADGLVRKFEGFRNKAGRTGDRATASLRTREAAMEIEQYNSTCVIRLTDATFISELQGFIETNRRNVVSWKTEDPDKERGRLDPSLRVAELERQLGTVTTSLRAEKEAGEILQGQYGALQERYTPLEEQVSSLEAERIALSKRVVTIEEEGARALGKVRDLEAALLDADPFSIYVTEFSELEQAWTRVREVIGGRELEDVVAITKAGPEVYLQAQLSNYNNIQALGGREVINAAKGIVFEETAIYEAERKNLSKAKGVLTYMDTLKRYVTDDGTVTDPEAATTALSIPEFLISTVLETTKLKVPEAELVVVRVEELRGEHQRRQALAQSIEEKEAEYATITNIPTRIEEVLGQKITATLGVKLLGTQGSNLVFEGRLPITREGKETELARTLQVCMGATITDRDNFPGLSFTEEEDSFVKYKFILPQREGQDALAITHTLAQRMTVLLSETDFGLAGGKIRVIYTGIIGELPSLESRVESRVQASVVTSEVEEDAEDEPSTESRRWGVERVLGSKVLEYASFVEMQEKEAWLLGVRFPTVEEMHLSTKKAVQDATQLNYWGIREVILAMTNSGLVRSKKIAPHIKERLRDNFGIPIPEDQTLRDRYAYRVNHWFESLVERGFLERVPDFIPADPCYQAKEKVIQKDLSRYTPGDKRILYTFNSRIPLGMHTAAQAVEYEQRNEERVCAGESFSPGVPRFPLLVRAAQILDHYTILTLLKDNPKSYRELCKKLKPRFSSLGETYVASSIARLRTANIEGRLEQRFEVLHR
ncbi:hypothetical protein EXS74_03730 [Candidatus Woesearchaeota archaeon]|nr:hypothetical protein [Candidatus Woesearchaeota archaeon]